MRGVVEEPAGLRYIDAFLGRTEHDELAETLSGLDYGEVRMHGQVARRVVRHYGVRYEYDSAGIRPGEPIPAWLDELRSRCAGLLGTAAPELAEVLVTRYPPGATIGWHRDAPAFGEVVGVSLLSPCLMRFQRGKGEDRRVFEQPLQPRSAYVLAGKARTVWQHSIPAVANERFSVTFRTIRRGFNARPAGQSSAVGMSVPHRSQVVGSGLSASRPHSGQTSGSQHAGSPPSSGDGGRTGGAGGMRPV